MHARVCSRSVVTQLTVLIKAILFQVWTSELQRTHQTAEHINAPKQAFPELNELDSGCFDDLTYKEFEDKYPAKFKEREANKLTFTYPEGESYVDVCR